MDEEEYGELDFHLTQVLNGNGCFEAYLHKVGNRPDAPTANMRRIRPNTSSPTAQRQKEEKSRESSEET